MVIGGLSNIKMDYPSLSLEKTEISYASLSPYCTPCCMTQALDLPWCKSVYCLRVCCFRPHYEDTRPDKNQAPPTSTQKKNMKKWDQLLPVKDSVRLSDIWAII